jgi:hypothetical protein
MTREEIYAAWAPDDGPWSGWVRPVPFALLPDDQASVALGVIDVTWADASRREAIVVDLPAVEAIAMGVALAERGYQPVPLFDAIDAPGALVSIGDIAPALAAAATRLASFRPASDASPAFLLDSRRMPKGVTPKPGDFDNRWITVPQDFPSASMLAARDIRAATVVEDAGQVADDLAHVLRRWQDAGVMIQRRSSDAESATVAIAVPRPRFFKSAFYLITALFGLRTASVGGFGASVPDRSGGG